MSSLPGGATGPSLFQIREPRRSFVGPFLLVILLHAGVLAAAARRVTAQTKLPPEPVKVVLKLPIRKVAVDEPPGGGPARPARPPPPHRQKVRRRIVAPKAIPPPVPETPPPPVPEPPQLAEAEEAGDEEGDVEGSLDMEGAGIGTGISPGIGPGRGSVKSKARKAWLSHTDWRCRRPGYDELGRIVVRLRVHVQPDGRPGQVSVTIPGPPDFNRRAIDCARDETYLPALDPEGRPIPGECEFSIEFLN